MTAYFDSLSQARFGSIAFAWKKIAVRSSLRKHVHEYRHTPGGALEKQGRTVYTIRVSGHFDEALNAKRKFGNYPENLASIRQMFENEQTDDLYIPTYGTIQACITEFSSDADPERQRSGEAVELEFTEDQSQRFLVDSVFVDLDSSGLEAASAGILDTATKLNVPTNLFDAITGAVDQVIAIRDQAEIYPQLVAGKLLYVASLCSEADRTLDTLKDPMNHTLLEALKVLWASVSELAKNVTEFSGAIQTYSVPQVMTIQQVSNAIYGRSDRAFDLLSLNEFSDALAIPAGSQVRYYVDAGK